MAHRILIVDDEPALQSMVREILEQDGYAAETAGTCAQALERFRAAAPDAVLLDVMLPDGDGFSLLGRLRAERDVPVLFLSARDEESRARILRHRQRRAKDGYTTLEVPLGLTRLGADARPPATRPGRRGRSPP